MESIPDDNNKQIGTSELNLFSILSIRRLLILFFSFLEKGFILLFAVFICGILNIFCLNYFGIFNNHFEEGGSSFRFL